MIGTDFLIELQIGNDFSAFLHLTSNLWFRLVRWKATKIKTKNTTTFAKRIVESLRTYRKSLPFLAVTKLIASDVVYWPSTRPNMPFQSDALEGSDTFRWQLWEEIV